MKHEVPTEEELRTTIQQVFNRCQKEHPDRLFSALVALVQMPQSKDDPKIHSYTPEYFDREMDEICEFSNRMNQLISLFPKSELPDEQKIWFDSTLKQRGQSYKLSKGVSPIN